MTACGGSSKLVYLPSAATPITVVLRGASPVSNVLPIGSCPGHNSIRHGAIDHRHFGRILAIAGIEHAAAQQSNAEGGEVIAVHSHLSDGNLLIAIRQLRWNFVIAQRQGQARRKGHRFHSSQGGYGPAHVLLSLSADRFGGLCHLADRSSPPPDFAARTRIGVTKVVQAALAQSHAHQNQGAHGHLHDHQSAPADVLAGSADHDFAAQNLRQIRPRGIQSGASPVAKIARSIKAIVKPTTVASSRKVSCTE